MHHKVDLNSNSPLLAANILFAGKNFLDFSHIFLFIWSEKKYKFYVSSFYVHSIKIASAATTTRAQALHEIVVYGLPRWMLCLPWNWRQTVGLRELSAIFCAILPFFFYFTTQTPKPNGTILTPLYHPLDAYLSYLSQRQQQHNLHSCWHILLWE